MERKRARPMYEFNIGFQLQKILYVFIHPKNCTSFEKKKVCLHKQNYFSVQSLLFLNIIGILISYDLNGIAKNN